MKYYFKICASLSIFLLVGLLFSCKGGEKKESSKKGDHLVGGLIHIIDEAPLFKTVDELIAWIRATESDYEDSVEESDENEEASDSTTTKSAPSEAVATLPKDATATIIDSGNAYAVDYYHEWELVKVQTTSDDKKITGWMTLNKATFDYSIISAIVSDIVSLKEYTKSIIYKYGLYNENVDQDTVLAALQLIAPELDKVRNDPASEQLRDQLVNWEFLIIRPLSDLEITGRPDGTTPLHYLAQHETDSDRFLNFIHLWRNPNLTTGPDGNTILIDAVLAKNSSLVNSLLKIPYIDQEYQNAAHKTAKDYAMESTDQKIKNIFTSSRKPEDYIPLAQQIVIKNESHCPENLFLPLPITVYYRSLQVGTPIKATTYEDFLTELSLNEEEAQLSQAGQKKDSLFPFTARIATDDGSALKMRDKPDVTGNTITAIQNLSTVTVLAQDAMPVEIDDIYDYWYNISLEDGTTGWCFGGFIQKPYLITDKKFIKEELGFHTRVWEPYENKYMVTTDTTLYTLNDNEVTLHCGDTVTLLEPLSNEYALYQGQKEVPLCLVETDEYQCGLIQGDVLSTVFTNTKYDDFIFLIQYWASEQTYRWLGSLAVYDDKNKVVHPIDFITPELDPDSYSSPSQDGMLDLGYYYEGMMHDHDYRAYDHDIGFMYIEYELSELKGKTNYVLEMTTDYYGDECNRACHIWTMDPNTYKAVYIVKELYSEWRGDYEYNGDSFSDFAAREYSDGEDFFIETYWYGRHYDEWGEEPREWCYLKEYTRSKNDITKFTRTLEDYNAPFPEW